MIPEKIFTGSIKNGAASLSSKPKMAKNFVKNYGPEIFGEAAEIKSSAKAIDLAEHPAVTAVNITFNCGVLLQHQKMHAVKNSAAIHSQMRNGRQGSGRIKKDSHECMKSKLPAALFGEFAAGFYGNLGACSIDL